MVKRIILLLIVLLNMVLLHGQSLKEDLNRLNQEYTTKEFYAELGYKFYSNNQLVEEYDAVHLQKGKNYYYKIKDLEILNNSKYQLVVNHFLKTILVMPSGSKKQAVASPKISIDTALKGVTGYKYAKVSGQEVKYTISLKKGEYKQIEIYFDSVTYIVSKLKLTVSDAYAASDPDLMGGVLEINYKKFNKTIPKDKTYLFTETRFLKVKGKKVSTQPNYNGYDLDDYLNF